jgi:thiamine pyrophosphate-dependent acetolactate synthase large subunit-like protein
LGQAYSDSSSVLVLSSVLARADLGLDSGRLHEVQNQTNAMAPLVGWSRTALTPDALPKLIDRAFAGFVAARPRPVHLEVPLDVLDEPAADAPRGPMPSRPAPARDAVERAARLCAGARRPVLLLGGGASDAGKSALALARRIGAVVVTTTAGSGVISADDPLSIGTSLATVPGRESLAEADLVIAAGTELAETDHWTDDLPITAPLIRIDIDLNELTDRQAELAILSDAGLAMAAICDALPGSVITNPGAMERAAFSRHRIRIALESASPDLLALVDSLRAAIPRDAVLATDMTKLGYMANVGFPSFSPRTYFHPSGYGTLGFALPFAIGAAIASRDRPAIAVMGDGGLQFTLPELACATEMGRQFTLVVYDNRGYGMIKDGMIRANINPLGVDPTGPRLDLLAQAYGTGYSRVEGPRELEAAVSRSLGRSEVTLIHVNAIA